jgi:hypothetical protein
MGRSLDGRTGLSSTIAAGARQHSRSRFRVPWDSRVYFIVSDSRLLFSLPPTTRRATVEVLDTASTGEWLYSDLVGLLCRVSVSTETPVDPTATCWFPRIQLYVNVFATRSLAMGLHVTVLFRRIAECRIEVVSFSAHLRQDLGWKTGYSELRWGSLYS